MQTRSFQLSEYEKSIINTFSQHSAVLSKLRRTQKEQDTTEVVMTASYDDLIELRELPARFPNHKNFFVKLFNTFVKGM